MSQPSKKELDSKESALNLENSEEPKLSQEQISLVDPSTERGSKKNYLIF
jgi:hypothetical protein